MKRIGVIFILFFAFCGVADSTYLTQHEINGTPLLCNINGLVGCNVVAESAYAHLFGIPLSEYGLLFYGALFVLAALELVLFDRVLRRAILGVAVLGVVVSAYFTLVQIFFIHAFCVYCTASAVLALLVLIFALMIEPARSGALDESPSSP